MQRCPTVVIPAHNEEKYIGKCLHTAYTGLLQNYQQTLNRFVGPTEILVSGDTLQLKDYSKLDWEWSYFDPEAKKLRHETVFPQECQKAYDKGAALLK